MRRDPTTGRSPHTVDLDQARRTLSSLCIYFYVQSVAFTREVIEGRTSLGGSESACLGLAAALADLGHDVHIFAAKLDLDERDPHVYAGVSWHHGYTLPDVLACQAPDVFVSLRMVGPFAHVLPAGLTLLWNQDMLANVAQIASALPQIDYLVYVSKYQRQQWEAVDPAILGATPSFVTRNGYDPGLVNTALRGEVLGVETVSKVPSRFCNISRPERGLGILLRMWGDIRKRLPEAELHLCRYDSMYDASGWGEICRKYDVAAQAVHEEHGGIVWHGNLPKRDLYRLIASSVAMLYPGVHDFGETSCLAAIEAQACGTPLIGSYTGALPETLGNGAGVLIRGKAGSDEYNAAFIHEVERMAVCQALTQTDAQAGAIGEHNLDEAHRYLSMQAAGRAHVYPAYTFHQLAVEWSDFLVTMFHRRYQAQKLKVLRTLMHWDHHLAGQLVAEDIIESFKAEHGLPASPLGHPYPMEGAPSTTPEYEEAVEARSLCGRVIRQEEQTAEHYGQHAMDTVQEMTSYNGRFKAVLAAWAEMNDGAGPRTILDVACGNGSFALLAAQRFPDARIDAWDYSAEAIRRGSDAAQQLDLASHVSFHVGNWEEIHGSYDAVFCGEFLEHTEYPHQVIDRLEQHCRMGGILTITCPCGPWTELLDYTQPVHRGHTHAFSFRDISILMQHKANCSTEYLPATTSPRGSACGFFIVRWSPSPMLPGTADSDVNPYDRIRAVPLDYWRTILTTRPYKRVVAGLIVRNAEMWIHRCLLSIWNLVDTIVLLDTGSWDATVAFAERFPNVKVYRVPWPDDFSVARNATLDLATRDHGADWFLWIDADEHLDNGVELHKYLQHDACYHGYTIRQHHLMLDSDRFFDLPVRIFRTDRGIRFYGVVHEQPETAMNTGVFPCLDTPDVNIVHYGYETEAGRRLKEMHRNVALLKKELAGQGTHPPRDMAYVLYIRSLVTIAGWEIGRSDPDPASIPIESKRRLASAIHLYRRRGFDRIDHRLHGLIWPSYQIALKWLGMGLEAECAFYAAAPRMPGGRPAPLRFFASTPEEAAAVVAEKTRLGLESLRPVTYDASPWQEADERRPPDIDLHQAEPGHVLEGAFGGRRALTGDEVAHMYEQEQQHHPESEQAGS